MYFYESYGLRIRSHFRFAELVEGGSGEHVWIRKGTLRKLPKLEPTAIHRHGIEALFGGTSQDAYLRWPGIATLRAQHGSSLIVDLDFDQLEPALLGLFVLSEPFGLILCQRGFLLLHASAVRIRGQAVIFVGPAGVGKSTTAAAFAKSGHTVLADDMVALTLNPGGLPILYSAYPRIKLWPSAAEALSVQPSSLSPLFTGSRKQEIRRDGVFPLGPFPVAQIFVLHDSPENMDITRMSGLESFFSLARFFPCPGAFLRGSALTHHFQQSVGLLHQVEMWQLERPKRFDALRDVVSAVERIVEAQS
jgi:hypothetical protein